MPGEECKDDKNGRKIPKWVIVLSILIPAVSSAGAAWYTLIKGDPNAAVAKDRVDKTWKEMKREVRKLTRAYNKLHIRVVYFQAREEGHTSGALQAKLDQLQIKYDNLALATKVKKPQVEVLRGILADERKLRAKTDRRKRAAKAAKGAVQMPAPTATPPPWRKK